MKQFFEIQDFSCGYEHKFHISGITISLPKGSFAGIIGPNGSGKTTLFRGITGELKQKAGSILLNGESLKLMSFKEKARQIAVVCQDDSDIPYIPVEDYVLMGRLPYRKQYQFFDSRNDYEIARKYMELTGVSRLQHNMLSQLSGGERQMVAITRALVQEPKLLLLDEPTSHLDITHQVKILNLVQKLNEQLGLTVLMIIHDLNLAGEYCNKLILMNGGTIQTTGTPEEVLTFKHIETAYKTVVVTSPNPVSGKPSVFLVSEKELKHVNRCEHELEYEPQSVRNL